MPFIAYAGSFISMFALALIPGIIAFTIWLGKGHFTYVSALWIMTLVLLLNTVKSSLEPGIANEQQNRTRP